MLKHYFIFITRKHEAFVDKIFQKHADDGSDVILWRNPFFTHVSFAEHKQGVATAQHT